ncbi:sulfonate ABC transporter substrate-binding protein [Bosea sp. PAMC 26642]|nr:sulfonate ABC transporter substrate-binding protein [Bosea sp. PAMC 26642]
MIGLGAAALASPSIVRAAPLERVSLRLNWVLSGLFSAFYNGRDKGFFSEEGIELTIGEGKGSGVTVQAVAAGGDTFGLADGGSIILGATKGAAVKAVMGIMNTSPYSISMREEVGVKTIKDLVGKTIAVTPGEAGLPLLQAIWAANGIDPASVKLLNVDGSGKLVAILSGRVDGVLAGLESQVVILAQKGLKQTVLKYADLGANTQGVSLFTTVATEQKQPDLVKRMVRAMIRSMKDAEQNPAAVVDAGIKAKPSEDKALFAEQLKVASTLFYAPSDSKKRLGFMMAEDWARTLELMKRYQDLVTDMPADRFYTNAFLPDVA